MPTEQAGSEYVSSVCQRGAAVLVHSKAARKVGAFDYVLCSTNAKNAPALLSFSGGLQTFHRKNTIRKIGAACCSCKDPFTSI